MTTPPYEPYCEKAILYHWTTPKSKAGIQAKGILPMQRKFIHLTTRPYAVSHAKRIAIELSSKRLIAAGLKLLKTANPEVILCDGNVSPHLIKRWIS